jgi:regulator of ribosome biosynthesis
LLCSSPFAFPYRGNLISAQFEPAEKSLDSEKKTSLAILSKLDGTKRPRKESSGGPPAGDDVLNVRKAVRFASKGRGGLALGREMRGRETAGRGGRGRGRGGGRGGKRGRGSR